MKKAFLQALIFSFLWNIAYSQNEKNIDSLKHVLSVVKQDTSRVKLMVELLNSYSMINGDSASWYGEQAISLARKTNFKTGESTALADLGLVFWLQGNLPRAFELEFEALKVAEDNQLIELISKPQSLIGIAYLDLKEYAKAMSYFRQGYSISFKCHQQINLAFVELNLGYGFEHLNQMDSALFYIHKAESDFTILGLANELAQISLEYGIIQLKKGNVRAAMEYFQTGIPDSLKGLYPRLIVGKHIQMAHAYELLHLVDSSIYFAIKGLKEAQKTQAQRDILEVATLLSELYEPTNPYEAIRYYKMASEANEKLFGAVNIQAIQNMFSKNQERQRDIEMAKLSYQNKLTQYRLKLITKPSP